MLQLKNIIFIFCYIFYRLEKSISFIILIAVQIETNYTVCIL